MRKDSLDSFGMTDLTFCEFITYLVIERVWSALWQVSDARTIGDLSSNPLPLSSIEQNLPEKAEEGNVFLCEPEIQDIDKDVRFRGGDKTICWLTPCIFYQDM